MVGENTSLRSAGWVSLCSLVQLILQFAFQVYLAKRFGASWEMDSYVASIALPTAASAVLVGSLGMPSCLSSAASWRRTRLVPGNWPAAWERSRRCAG